MANLKFGFCFGPSAREVSETVRRRTAEDGAATDADYAGAGGLGSDEAAAGRLLQGGRLSTQRACLKIL